MEWHTFCNKLFNSWMIPWLILLIKYAIYILNNLYHWFRFCKLYGVNSDTVNGFPLCCMAKSGIVPSHKKSYDMLHPTLPFLFHHCSVLSATKLWGWRSVFNTGFIFLIEYNSECLIIHSTTSMLEAGRTVHHEYEILLLLTLRLSHNSCHFNILNIHTF
jgi:hypothetical protein